MDSAVHRAFPKKRLKRQQTVPAHTYSHGSQREERDPCLPSFLLSHYLLSILVLQMITCSSLHHLVFTSSPPVISLASLRVYSRLAEESRLLLTLSLSSLHLLPLLCNQFSLSPFMILFHSYRGFQGQPSLFFSPRLFVLNKATAREQLVLR